MKTGNKKTSAHKLAKQLGIVLKSQGLFIVTAESCTGGLLASTLTEIPGSSNYFERGFVVYSNSAKQKLLQVKPRTLKKFGAVSEQVAIEMAKGALSNSNSQLSIAITGIAGPTGGTKNKPIGTVCFACYLPVALPKNTVTMHFHGNRRTIREKAVEFALHYLLIILNQKLKLNL